MARYAIDINWSDVDQAFVARVPDVPGCMAHGPSRDEAFANAENAIHSWIETAEEFGDPVPRPPHADVRLSAPKTEQDLLPREI